LSRGPRVASYATAGTPAAASGGADAAGRQHLGVGAVTLVSFDFVAAALIARLQSSRPAVDRRH